jgi:cytochrome c oxidase subunit 2
MIDWLFLPKLASEHGAKVDSFILYIHWLMVALFVGWSAYFFYALWRFRASRNPKASYVGVRSHASTYIEGIVVVAEAVLLIGFAIPLWVSAVDQFPPPEESVLVNVTGRQFNWLARYPGPDHKFGKQDVRLVSADNPMGIVARNEATKAEDPTGTDDFVVEGSEVVVPLNKPVIVRLTSMDVIHSFKVPALRVCQDATPGISIPIHFTATEVGNYLITCAQLCGQGHYSMRGVLKVLPQAEFDQWMTERSSAAAAPAESYE